MAKKYIYINGKKIYVTNEIYKEYKKCINRECYLKNIDKKHNVYGFDDYRIEIDNIADDSVNIEKIIETKMRIEDLYKALDNLNDEEKKIIDSLYFDKMTIRDLAKEKQVSSKKIFSFRNSI